jgi:hypothetical protein
MIGLYLVSIGIAWLVAPRRQEPVTNQMSPPGLKLVFAAAVIDQVRRQRQSPGDFPRLWRG